MSNVNVRLVTGDCTFSALSVARTSTVYVPSAGKFEAGKAWDQLVVPLARFQS